MNAQKRKLDLFYDSDDSDGLEHFDDKNHEDNADKGKEQEETTKTKDKKSLKNAKSLNSDLDFINKLEKKIEKSSNKKTSKLIELQSKFAYDSRFTIDDRFVYDDDEDENDCEDFSDKKTKISNDDHDEDLNKERLKNLSILEHVLQKKIQGSTKEDQIIEFRKSQTSKKASSNFATILAPRFDPLKEDSKKYEIQDQPDKINQKLNIDFDELDRKEEEKQKKELERKRKANLNGPLLGPGQTDRIESFYEVNANLKDTFGDSNDFVFDLFQDKKDLSEDVHTLNEAAKEVLLENVKKTISQTKNPFKYDSSDDEDEPKVDFNKETKVNQSQTEVKALSLGNVTLSSKKERKKVPIIEFSGFFFKKNDPRLTKEVFWNPEVVKKIKYEAGKRKEAMRIALKLRKKAAQKNIQLKKRIEKKRMLLTPKQFKASMANQNKKKVRFNRKIRTNRK